MTTQPISFNALTVEPLSSHQERLWFIDRFETGNVYASHPIYHNIPLLLHLKGDVDRESLESSLRFLIGRHAALRTRIVVENNRPMQVVRESVDFQLPVVSVTVTEGNGTLDRAVERALREARRPFDLSNDLLVRAVLFMLGDHESLLLVVVHHIAADRYSIDLLTKELSEIYPVFIAGGLPDIRPIRYHYTDYAHWQRKPAPDDWEPYWFYWRWQLRGKLQALELPEDRRRPAVHTFTDDRVLFEINAEFRHQIRDRGQQSQISAQVLCHAAWSVLFHHYSRQEEIVIGTSMPCRRQPELEQTFGPISNLVVLRHGVNDDDTIEAVCHATRKTLERAERYQEMPFDKLVSMLDPEKDMSRTALFDVLVQYQCDGADSWMMADLVVRKIETNLGYGKYDLHVLMNDTSDRVSGTIVYNADIYDRATIERMVRHFQAVLNVMVTSPDCRVGDIDVLSEEEKQKELVKWNATDAGYPCEKTIHQLFEEQAVRTPDRIAVSCDGRLLTYRELDRCANRLANLLRDRGVVEDCLVAVCLERSLETVVALLAVLKAGGAYLPLDPAAPEERLRFMLADAEIAHLITTRSIADRIPYVIPACIALDADERLIASMADTPPRTHSKPHHLAYCIYTSGSTGQPKGVLIEHRNVVRLMVNDRLQFEFSERDVWTMFHSFTFDFSVWEMYGALLYGGKLVVVPKEIARDPALFWDLILREKVTVLNQTPSAFSNLIREALASASDDTALRYVVFGGEALHPAQLRSWRERYPNVRLINMYGITETTVHVTFKEIAEREINENTSNIGVPIPTTTTYIMDSALHLLPIGVPGEIYVGGGGVARGYLKRDDLTRQKFVENPYRPGERLYRSGDSAKRLLNGEMVYLGRIDDQVQIRGFRVELGEIQTQLLNHPAVAEAEAIAWQRDGEAASLAAYIVPRREVSISDLRNHLIRTLPDYMIPSVFITLEAFPLTSNGKIDRRALPDPTQVRLSLEAIYTPPRSESERRMAAIWMETLERDRVGIHDNFFELGGHSLLATQLVSRIRAAFSVELPLRHVFERPTVAGLCEAIAELEAHSQPAAQPAIQAIPRSGPLPLSYAQQRMWLLHRLEGGGSTYNIPAALRIRGPLDRSILERCLNEIVRRHEVLRTSFPEKDGVPEQLIAAEMVFPLEWEDVSSLPAEESHTRIKQRIEREASRVFDLERGPLIRGLLLCENDVSHVLVVVMHHIVSDGWTSGIVVRELGALYEAFTRGRPSPLPELAVQYADFAAWQREWLQGDVLENQLAYWREKMSGAPAILELPTDRPRPPVQTFRGRHLTFALDAEVTERIKRLSQNAGATPFMTLQSVFLILLARYSGQDDIVIGSGIANRRNRETESIAGFFVNTLLLRTNLSGNPTFADLLARVKQTDLEAYEHQDVPFEKLVDELQPVRHLGYTPLFQVLFTLQNLPSHELDLPGLIVEPIEIETGTAKFDFIVLMEETRDGLLGIVEYNADLFETTTIERMISHFRILLKAALSDPQQPIDTLPLLTERERLQILDEWNRTYREYPHNSCIHTLFEAQAAVVPDKTAVLFESGEGESRSGTYNALNAYANRIARAVRSAGAQPGSHVALMVERSVEIVAAMLGILKAGCAYVPLDLAYPKERLAYMMRDAQVSLLVSKSQWLDLISDQSVAILCLDTDCEFIEKQSSENLECTSNVESSAQLIYTSGSTGEPKGVTIPHRGVVRLVKNTDYIHLDTADRVAQVSNISFDAATFEVWGALLNGATLVGFAREITLSPVHFVERLRAQNVTTLLLTTAMFNQLSHEVPSGYQTLRNVLFGGEEADPNSVRRVLREGPPERLLNAYGPTENTTISTWHLVTEVAEDATTIPIGKPIANSTAIVLDRNRQLVPTGVPGELYVGGDGLALGYWNRPELTSESFILNPYDVEGRSRLYRTGDVVRYRPDGSLEFLGRTDHQVKIRGFRIELGEIESALLQHPAVREAVVLYRNQRLIAYVVSHHEAVPITQDLGKFLKTKLPEYMVPSAFVTLDAFPLNANGKIDRHQLPDPEPLTHSGEYLAPRTPVEELIAAIWSCVLGVERVGVECNFFELGGHSLMATQVVSRIREALGVDLPLRVLFQAPTVAGVAASIESIRNSEASASPPIVRIDRCGESALSFAQERLWFLDRLEPGNPFYNVSIALRLEGRLDVSALEKSLNEIVRRHESLRTTFTEIDGKPVQVIADDLSIVILTVDLTDVPEAERHVEMLRIVMDDAQRPFDLARGPLLRAVLIRLSVEEHVLQLNMHHIVSDGWSLGIFIQEWVPLYTACYSGEPSPLPPLPIQYADFAAWQREWLQGDVLEIQLAYWKKQLAGTPPILELPADRPRPPVQSFQGSSVKFEINAETTAQLRRLSRQTESTLFMTLLSAYAVLLSRLSGQDDFAVGSPIANRTRSEIEPLIGFFVNTMVLRMDVSGNPPFETLVERVRRSALDAYSHQDLPFEKLVDEIQPERDLSLNPLFQVMFALQNAPLRVMELPQVKIMPLETKRVTALFDLVLDMWETGETLTGVLEFNTDLFDEATAARWVKSFQTILEAVAEHPQQTVSELPLLAQDEERELLRIGSGPRVEYPVHRTIHDLFEERAARDPDRVAAVHNGVAIRYDELNRRANQIAHRLRRAGVRRNDFVGILDRRGIDVLSAMLGILKAGGAFMPVDPGYPEDRVRYMIENSRIRTLITRSSIFDTFAFVGKLGCLQTIVRLDCDDFHEVPDTNPETVNSSGDRAYMLYTSGSTGLPKGAIVRHNGAVNHIFAEFDWLKFHPDSAFLQSAPSSSDISVWQFLAPGLIGGRTAIADYETVCDPARLFETIKSERITIIELVPVVMKELLEFVRTLPREQRALPDLECAMATGEAVSVALVNLWLDTYPTIPIVNAYGPTEAADDISQYVITKPLPPERRGVPIGYPLANLTLYVLDSNFHLVPFGVAGEICVSGIGVGEGYWNDEVKTKAAFVPNPYAGEGRGDFLYRTGDLGRWLPDGTLECLDRLDSQVKLRGFRIELGEIEGALGHHPAVRETATVVREDRPGDKRLAAYVVPNMDSSAVQDCLVELKGRQVELWQELHENSYKETLIHGDTTFNVIGWDSNYTGRPLPEIEMREYVAGTIERIHALNPRRVLEIGCGTGLIAFPLIPHCQSYTGTDLSQVTIDRLRTLQSSPELQQRVPGLDSAVFIQKRADDFSGFADGTFDTACMTSVVQYFPGIDYLLGVLDNLLRVVEPGGAIFLGDVRCLPLLEAFHASVQLYKAPNELSIEELRGRIRQHLAQEQEMAVDPAFFAALAHHDSRISAVEILPKLGLHHNEMTRFRYDVILHVGRGPRPQKAVNWSEWTPEQWTISAIRQYLQDCQPDCLGLKKVANARVWLENQVLQWLGSGDRFTCVSELRAVLNERVNPGLEPEELWKLGGDISYRVDLSFSNGYTDGAFDMVFSKHTETGSIGPLPCFIERIERKPWRQYANNPLQEKLARKLAPLLRDYLKEKIPNYMVPSDYVLLDALPLNPAGKVDRQALPKPDASVMQLESGYMPPASREEAILCEIWAEVLGLERVGTHSNFFDLGGHSLKATQVVSRIYREFNVELSLRELFAHPTVAELAALLPHRTERVYSAIDPVQDAETYPLSHGQRRLWVLAQMEGASVAYNMPAALLLEGPIHRDAFQQAFDGLVQRHEILRTAFVMVDGEPRQRVLPHVDTRIVWHDVSSDASPEARARESALDDAVQVFDFERGGLIRISLVKLASERHVLLFNTHHIVSDDWSMSVLIREFVDRYKNIQQGSDAFPAPLRIQYRDYASWQHRFLQSEDGVKHRAYWHETLSGEIPVLDMPIDFPRPPVKTYHGGVVSQRLDRRCSEQVYAFCRKQSVSLFAYLAAAVQTLLHRYTHQEEIIVGFPVAGRNHADLEDQIGFYINTLPLKGRSTAEKSFAQFLHEVNDSVTGALDHQLYPFDRLVDELKLSRDVSRSPMFDVAVVLQNAGGADLQLDGVAIRPFVDAYEFSKFDLVFTFEEKSDGLQLDIVYNSDLYLTERIERMQSHFRCLVEAVLLNSQERLECIPILSESERRKLLVEFNPPRRRFEVRDTLIGWFERQVEQTPERTAVVFEDVVTHDSAEVLADRYELSYRELNHRANQLAHYLRAQGINRGSLVGIFVERSLDTVIAILGVLKAGGTYVPLDTNQPKERLALILDDAALPLVLSQEKSAGRFPETSARVIFLDRERQVIDRESADNPTHVTLISDCAYIIYTSGSTGKPKGVMVSHANVVRLFLATEDWFHFNQDDIWTLFHSYAFDFSVWEMWGALLYGGKLVVIPYWLSRSPQTFFELLVREKVTVLNQTPSAFRQLMDAETEVRGSTHLALRYVIFGGEALDLQSLKPWFDRRGDETPQLINMYGITETTVHVTYRPITKNDLDRPASLVGKPIPDLQIYLLDRNMQPVPLGVPGEICVGGDGVAQGYLNRPELTQEKFVPNPLATEPSVRLYRSGDLARYLPDGDIEYLGRMDQQVQVRGFRVELGEIEAALVTYSGIRDAVILAREKNGGLVLTAYYRVADGETFDANGLRAYLRERLPDYMVPAHFVRLERYPLTTNGKLDTKALPGPEEMHRETASAYLAPRNSLEKTIAELMREIVGIDRVGVNDNFFDLGANSMSIVQLHNRIRKSIGRDIPVVTLFQYPTVSALAGYLGDEAPMGTVTQLKDIQERAEKQKQARLRRGQKRNQP